MSDSDDAYLHVFEQDFELSDGLLGDLQLAECCLVVALLNAQIKEEEAPGGVPNQEVFVLPFDGRFCEQVVIVVVLPIGLLEMENA